MRRALAPVLAAAALLAAPAAALAHVTVLPEKPKLNSEQEFVIRVPDEVNVATTGVEIILPEGINATQFAPKPGWKRDVKLTAD